MMRNAIMAGLLLGMAHGAAQARTVVPTFTTGTVTSETTTRTEVTEIISQVEYTTGNSYTVSGHNIKIPGSPGPNTNYSIMNQGGAFQFSETHLLPGIAK